MSNSARRLGAAFALGSVVLFSAAPAFAEEPVETAIRGWVAAIDASPYFVAGIGDLTYDAATKTASVRNLAIRTENISFIPGGKLEITFDRIDLAGFSQQADGAFEFSEARAKDARILAAVEIAPPPEPSDKVPAEDPSPETSLPVRIDTKIASLSIKNGTMPSFATLAFDPAKPIASWIAAASIAVKASFDSFDTQGITSDSEMQGEKSHSTIDSYQVFNQKDGRIERASMGALNQETPSPNGLVKMRIGSAEVRGYDLNGLLDVLDPNRYASGAGDGKWRTVVALEALRDMSITIPGGEVRVGAYEFENAKVRQPSRPLPIAELDQLLSSGTKLDTDRFDALMAEHLPSLVSWFGIGAFRLTDLDVVAPEIQRFHLGDFHINELSSDGLGEIGIGDIDVSVEGKGSVGAERIAFGGFRFPAMDKIVAAIKAEKDGTEVDPLPLIPTMGYAEAINFDIVEAGKKLGTADRARLDLSDYIGPVPTTIALDLRGLDLDLSMVDDPKARQMIQGLGYDRLQAEYGFKLHWREADESLNLDDFNLAIKDVGAIKANVALTGLKRTTIENPMNLENDIAGLLFSRGKVVVQDNSVVDRAIGMEAKKKKQTPEKFREDIAGALPLTLMLVLKNPTFQQKLAPALQAFIRTPGTLTLTAAPATPVPLFAIIQAAQDNPRSLPDLISLEVKADK